MGNFRNVGTHKNPGIGTNTEPDYRGNTNASGVTDKTGQPIKGMTLTGMRMLVLVLLIVFYFNVFAICQADCFFFFLFLSA